MLGHAAFDLDLAARDRGGDDKCSRLDTVGNDSVLSGTESLNTLDLYRRSSGTFNAGSHLIQKLSEIVDLRFLSGVVNDRPSLRQRGCHHHVFGAGDRDLFEVNVATDEPAFWGTSD